MGLQWELHGVWSSSPSPRKAVSSLRLEGAKEHGEEGGGAMP
jgi:hypothetical protein